MSSIMSLFQRHTKEKLIIRILYLDLHQMKELLMIMDVTLNSIKLMTQTKLINHEVFHLMLKIIKGLNNMLEMKSLAQTLLTVQEHLLMFL